MSEAGISFYMYHSDQFLSRAQQFLSIEDQESAVEEAKEIRAHDEARQSTETPVWGEAVLGEDYWSSPTFRAMIGGAGILDPDIAAKAVIASDSMSQAARREAEKLESDPIYQVARREIERQQSDPSYRQMRREIERLDSDPGYRQMRREIERLESDPSYRAVRDSILRKK